MIRKLKESALTKDGLVGVLAEVGLLVKDGDRYVPVGAQKRGGDDGGKGGDGEGGKGKVDPAVATLQHSLNEMQEQINQRDEELKREREARFTADRRISVVEAMRKAGANNPERDHIHIADRVKQSAAGEWVVSAKDAAGNEIEVPIEKFVSKYMEENPDLRKPAGQGGAGVKPAAGTASAIDELAKGVPKGMAFKVLASNSVKTS